jgi:hypothetical protein
MFRPAFNGTDQPLVIDDDGRTLGGNEWGAVDADTDRVKTHVEAGSLIVVDPESISEAANPDAVAAKAHADRANREAKPKPPAAKVAADNAGEKS